MWRLWWVMWRLYWEMWRFPLLQLLQLKVSYSGVLNEIWVLIESVSEGVPTYTSIDDWLRDIKSLAGAEEILLLLYENWSRLL